MCQKRGFTLVELLVVIAIIGLLVSILAPSLMGILNLAKAAVCSSRLEAIGKGAVSYASNNNQSLPYRADASYTVFYAGRYYSDYQDNNTDSRCNSRVWYMLVVEDIVPVASFTCPADSGAEPLQVNEGNYDFDPSRGAEARPLSYSMQTLLSGHGGATAYDPTHERHCKPVTMLSSSALVIGADYTGLGYWEYKWAYWHSQRNSVVMDENNAGLMNSENHDRRGQNVLSLDGHVKFEESPMVGIDGDNIWTRRGRSHSGIKWLTDRPADRDDTLLKP